MCKTTRRLWAETSRECPLQSDQQTWKISTFWCTCCRVDVTWCWNVVDESKYWVAGKKLSWNSYLMVILKLSYHSNFFFFGIRVAPTFQHDALERTEAGGSTSKLGTWAHRRSTWMQHHWTDVEWESSTLIWLSARSQTSLLPLKMLSHDFKDLHLLHINEQTGESVNIRGVSISMWAFNLIHN